MLDLQVLRFDPGTSSSLIPSDTQALLFIVSGSGSLVLNDESHAVESATAALLLPGESFVLENTSSIEVVWVTAPAVETLEREHVAMRLADRPEQRADENRTFRVLFETNVTQFVGVVQPSRAADHSHPFDEVGTILEGHGFAHVGGESRELSAGSRFQLAPDEVHCIENSGPGPMRILGVFYPSGSPAQRNEH